MFLKFKGNMENDFYFSNNIHVDYTCNKLDLQMYSTSLLSNELPPPPYCPFSFLKQMSLLLCCNRSCLHVRKEKIEICFSTIKAACTSFLARGVDHHRASRVRNTQDIKLERPKQMWRRAAFFTQGYFCTVGDKIRI